MSEITPSEIHEKLEELLHDEPLLRRAFYTHGREWSQEFLETALFAYIEMNKFLQSDLVKIYQHLCPQCDRNIGKALSNE